MTNIHFIAIGGQVMHNLAIALQEEGIQVTGSDDAIYNPSADRLRSKNLFPNDLGWHPERITSQLDAVIVGMHAQKDNPEWLKAKDLGLKIYSFPEYIFEHARHKQRIVIAGSHGKTTVTAMIMHVLKAVGRDFDYVLGAYVKGFESTVRLSKKAHLILIEGDEYATAPDKHFPKFLNYQHHIAAITGIAWDHANIYPDAEVYAQQFAKLIRNSPKAGSIVYFKKDKQLAKLVKSSKQEDVTFVDYDVHSHTIKNGQTLLRTEGAKIPVPIFGKHNMANLSAAKAICIKIGVQEEDFYRAIATFEGADKRLQRIGTNGDTHIFWDFAHAPSKVEASVKAVKGLFPKQKLLACAELHTFSSLNKNFLNQYKDRMKQADEAVVYFNPELVEKKGFPALSAHDLQAFFNRKDLKVFSDSAALQDFLRTQNWRNKNLLMMSSGTFNGLNIKGLADFILK